MKNPSLQRPGFAIVAATMQILYTIGYSLGFVLLSPVFLYKMWKRGKYRKNFFQRFGVYSPEARHSLAQKAGPRCWIQAVSVGEVNVALAFIAALQQRLPRLRVVLTTTTSTGHALALERLPQEVDLVYFPQDFPWSVRRAYNLIQPDLVVLMESEIWPNHIREGLRRGLPIFLVNARMSSRSAPRYRRFAWFFRDALSRLTLICAQTREDADNFRAAGASADRVQVTGNMKYDTSLPHTDVPAVDPIHLLERIGVSQTQPILVAGSTHPGEEVILFDVFEELRAGLPNLFLVLVPRHVERTPEIIELARRRELSFVLRSDVNADFRPAARPYDCLLVNTTGELKSLYRIATVIFVGKSLVGQGGQNIVEAAASGHPVVFGPNMQNFKAIAEQFVTEGAGVQVPDARRLRETLTRLLHEQPEREKIVAAARRVIEANAGAMDRTVELIVPALPAATRNPSPAPKNAGANTG